MSRSLLIAGILTLEMELAEGSSNEKELDKLEMPLAELLVIIIETVLPREKLLILPRTVLLDIHVDNSDADDPNDKALLKEVGEKSLPNMRMKELDRGPDENDETTWNKLNEKEEDKDPI